MNDITFKPPQSAHSPARPKIYSGSDISGILQAVATRRGNQREPKFVRGIVPAPMPAKRLASPAKPPISTSIPKFVTATKLMERGIFANTMALHRARHPKDQRPPFPQPEKLGGRINKWKEEAVAAWLSEIAAWRAQSPKA